ncbi:3561_t:CDS:2 [Paraglomus occultum]|uniref:3561_t:CDS:1 n=1 Tax=Paraglomus occultum TaxID=144539 RepID=A0A9N9FYT0_9GLOM|nr:3561_t:CDS:2 [Paraglomus occultum]
MEEKLNNEDNEEVTDKSLPIIFVDRDSIRLHNNNAFTKP